MRRATAVLLLAGSLVGCASHSVSESPWLVQRDTTAPKRCEPLTADQELVLGLSQEMASAGRWHAALANLERLPEDVPQVRLSKARLLRLLGHSNEAETLYGSLLNSCLVADANHGLGQIEAGRSRYTEAQGYLRTAASLSPANEAVRNDLGVAYMNQRRMSEARFELLTAMELGENSRRAALNMLTLLVYQGNWQAAQELVSAKGLSSDDFKLAEQRARSMRNQDANKPMTATPAPAVVGRPLATAEPAGTAEAVASLVTPVASAPSVRAADTVPAAATAPAPVRTQVRNFAAAPAAAPTVGVAAAVFAAAPAPTRAPVTAPAPVRAFAAAPAATEPSVRAAAPVAAATPTPGALRTPSRRGAPPTCDDTASAQTQDACRRAASAPAPTSVRAFAGAPAAAGPDASAPITAPAPTPVRAFAAAPVEAAPRAEAAGAAPGSTPIRDFAAAPAAAPAPMPLSAAARAWAVEDATSVNSAANQVRGVQQAPSAGARPIVCRSSGASTPGLAVMECLPE